MDEKRQQRQFKFRAYDTKNKKWLHHYEALGGFSLKGEVVVMHEIWEGLNLNTLLDHVVIMQYTGLNDRKHKEIYEGDRVKVWTKPNREEYSYEGVVEWYFPNLGNWHGDCEVIGNIYENPELSES